MVRGARVSAVIASTDAIAVESGCAVGHGTGPFTDDGPLVRARVYVCVVADVLAVLPWLHGHEVVAEAGVLVVINDDPLGVVVGRSQEAVEGVCVLEAVVEHEDTGLRDVALVAVRIAVVLAGSFWVESRIQRLVERLNRGNDVVVVGGGVLFLDLTQNGKRTVNGVALLPARCSNLLARVVESVLRAGCAVQVDDDFDADFPCPLNTLVKELGCALRIWRVGVVKGPETDRNPDHVETAVLDLLEVLELDPVLPVGS